ncbi:MAG: hypothetical protein V1873_07355 [Verrucomicrobiota bacterium]
MKTFKFLAIVSLVVLAGTVPSRADWEVGGSFKMHWPQMPDLTTNGMDVNATANYVLADDFRCTQSGPVTNIHIWGSWLGIGDTIDTTAVFRLSIHADIPAEPTGMYSMPSNPPLWQDFFTPNLYQWRVWAGGIQEGWYEPPSGYMPPPADTICYQYNFPIGVQDAFVQTSGTVYWLDVQVVQATNSFGWKTSTNHWNDDAVYSFQLQPWAELRYPDGHPLHPQSIDLAFVIEGLEVVPPVPPECLKWLQDRDCDNGLNIESWRPSDVGAGGPHVADDWYCDGRPITAIEWWGSYLGYATNSGTPTSPPPQRPQGFVLTWYTDVPKGVITNYSMPGLVLATNFYPLAAFESNRVGMVYETTECVTRLSFVGTNVFEHEYRYYINTAAASNLWLEKDGRVYWLGIEAVYAGAPAQNPWGWKTAAPPEGWNDAAVNQAGPMLWTNMTFPPPGWGWVTNHPYQGEPVNMAFALYTEVCPARCKKWAQAPDLLLGDDLESFYWNGQAQTNVVRADDFISDGRPITDIHWWGSYIGWRYDQEHSDTNPAPIPEGNDRLIGFRLSWHNNSAPCYPWPEITNVFVPISNCYEVYFGTVTQFWKQTHYYEHEFQYYVDLLSPAVTNQGLGPWLEQEGVQYWLNIQGVFTNTWLPGRHQGWGWKLAEKTNLCGSMVSFNGGIFWSTNALQAPHPLAGQAFDLAFELTTTNIAWATNVVRPALTRIAAMQGINNTFLWSTGHCGCGQQVIQAATNLVGGEPVWLDLYTNNLPRPDNFWTTSPLISNEFFRIMAVP